jgi:hypothetical protein
VTPGTNAIPTVDLGTWRSDPRAVAAQVELCAGALGVPSGTPTSPATNPTWTFNINGTRR